MTTFENQLNLWGDLMTTDIDMSRWTLLAEIWAPRVGAAVLILVLTWLLAGVLKGLLAKGLDRIPLAAQHNHARPADATFGTRLGTVAYWLVVMFGLIAALNVLQLGQVVTPLNDMLTNFLSYVPNVVGAGLIFFVGFIIASVASNVVKSALQAADLDRLLDKLGLGSAGGAGFAGAIGTLVFVLIIVPVSIAALQALKIDAISGPAIAVLTTILNAVPNVVAAGIVLAIGLLIGRWIGGVAERLLPATGIDRLFGAVRQLSSAGTEGNSTSSTTTAAPTASKIFGGIIMFAVVALSAIEAARLLHFAALAVILEQILNLAGHVVLGGAIIAVGVVIADILANAIQRSMSEGDKFAASLAKWATIALATAMGLRAMGIADEIVVLAFGLILGSAALAGALAFGLGARPAAGRLADQWVEGASKKKPPQ